MCDIGHMINSFHSLGGRFPAGFLSPSLSCLHCHSERLKTKLIITAFGRLLADCQALCAPGWYMPSAGTSQPKG